MTIRVLIWEMRWAAPSTPTSLRMMSWMDLMEALRDMVESLNRLLNRRDAKGRRETQREQVGEELAVRIDREHTVVHFG